MKCGINQLKSKKLKVINVGMIFKSKTLKQELVIFNKQLKEQEKEVRMTKGIIAKLKKRK